MDFSIDFSEEEKQVKEPLQPETENKCVWKMTMIPNLTMQWIMTEQRNVMKILLLVTWRIQKE